MAHSAEENTMLALQRQHPRYMMGLGSDGQQLVTTTTDTIATRVAAIRAKMLTLGIPMAVGSGAVTMLTFAAAFGLARTERVWAPAIWLGAMTTVGALVSVAVAAKVAQDATQAMPSAPMTTAAAAAPVATPAPTPTAFFFY